MDPDENLTAQLRLAVRIQVASNNDRPIDPDDADRLAELVLSLNDWIRGGGFLPAKWSRGR